MSKNVRSIARCAVGMGVMTVVLGGAGVAAAAGVDTQTVYNVVDGSQDCAYMGGETLVVVYSPTSPGTALVRVGNPAPHITSLDNCTP